MWADEPPKNSFVIKIYTHHKILRVHDSEFSPSFLHSKSTPITKNSQEKCTVIKGKTCVYILKPLLFEIYTKKKYTYCTKYTPIYIHSRLNSSVFINSQVIYSCSKSSLSFLASLITASFHSFKLSVS